MIGHFLLTLTTEQENRVLTRAFEPIVRSRRLLAGLPPDWEAPCVGCLLMASGQVTHWGGQNISMHVVGMHYEDLAGRFGAPRVNAAIRNRILSNRARRVLQHRPVQLETVTP